MADRMLQFVLKALRYLIPLKTTLLTLTWWRLLKIDALYRSFGNWLPDISELIFLLCLALMRTKAGEFYDIENLTGRM